MSKLRKHVISGEFIKLVALRMTAYPCGSSKRLVTSEMETDREIDTKPVTKSVLLFQTTSLQCRKTMPNNIFFISFPDAENMQAVDTKVQ